MAIGTTFQLGNGVLTRLNGHLHLRIDTLNLCQFWGTFCSSCNCGSYFLELLTCHCFWLRYLLIIEIGCIVEPLLLVDTYLDVPWNWFEHKKIGQTHYESCASRICESFLLSLFWEKGSNFSNVWSEMLKRATHRTALRRQFRLDVVILRSMLAPVN